MFDNFENETSQDMMMQEKMELIREQLIYANWEMLSKNGIDVKNVDNLPLLVETLTQMLEFFEQTEEYEKCMVIYNYLQQL